jgi:hypothetical protein
MIVPPSDAWKLVLAIALGAVIVLGAYGAAPRRAVPFSDLRRLVFSALGLYVVGAVASLKHHTTLAAIVYASGIGICALALWLSRGAEPGEDPPPGGDEPTDERPPPSPDGVPSFDWSAFEREFRSYSERPGSSSDREPALR